jgi:hypothetical protein
MMKERPIFEEQRILNAKNGHSVAMAKKEHT